MVSCRGELFRRGVCDETFGAEMRVISICGKLEDFRRGLVSPGANLFVVPANAGAHNHRCCLERTSTAACQYERRGVWVPAFAGTTEIVANPSRLSARTDSRRRGWCGSRRAWSDRSRSCGECA